MSGWFVYLLRCQDGSLYCGATNDPWRRFSVHQRGKGARYTRARLPVQLVFLEETEGRSAALRLEHAIKRLPARVKRLIVHPPRTFQHNSPERAPIPSGTRGEEVCHDEDEGR